MPRASSSAKRQQGANQRDTRHENGLVGPGKRIQKQKSHRDLADGSPRAPAGCDAASSTHPPVPAVPAAVLNGHAKDGLDAAGDHHHHHHRASDHLRVASLGRAAESSSTESLHLPPSMAGAEENHRRIDVNAAKNANVHRDPGPINFALTVLRSCPLYDTIAILIILMQLSPIAISLVYLLFTVLTFVPPVTTSSGISLADVFEAGMSLSLTTLVCMDVVGLLIWLFLWESVQSLSLDFAQVVIAVTLGGGANSRQGSANNILICIGITLLSHFGRLPGVGNLPLELKGLLGAGRMADGSKENPLEPVAPVLVGRKGAYPWIRNILAIHILTQGIVKYIRDWYIRRERRDQSQNQLDPESGKALFESSSEGITSDRTTAESEGAVQSTAANLSSKKKKKQSHQVRVRQPLWAALASTKIVMVKEYELSHAASESAGSNATDVDNLGNAPFSDQPCQIWICYVGSDEVCFDTSPFPNVDPDPVLEAAGNDEDGPIPKPPQKTAPFFVRINHNSVWTLTNITPVDNRQEPDTLPGTRWTGTIYGLSPLSTYECEFVDAQTHEVLFSTSVRTNQARIKPTDATVKAPVPPRRRHESPATTIRATIAAQEIKLQEAKTKLKALRKDGNRRLNALRKDIDKLTSAVQSSGGNDEKLRQKISQNNTQLKQAEQSIQELEDELEKYEKVPEELVEAHRAKHNEYMREKAQYDGARASFKSFKNNIEEELKGLEDEKSQLEIKRTKIATRISKADSEYRRITDANAKGMDEAERQRQLETDYQAETLEIDRQRQDKLQKLRMENAQRVQTSQNLAATLQGYLSSFENDVYEDSSYNGVPYSAAPAVWPATTTSHIPPGSMWPVTSAPSNPSLLPASATFRMPMLSQQPSHVVQPVLRMRGRSSSMLSDVSGFTQSSGEDDHGAIGLPRQGGAANNGAPRLAVMSPRAAAHIASGLRGPPGFDFARAGGSSGSGSGVGIGASSGSGSGSSVRSEDPTSPV